MAVHCKAVLRSRPRDPKQGLGRGKGCTRAQEIPAQRSLISAQHLQ